jgi:hypothetical protein
MCKYSVNAAHLSRAAASAGVIRRDASAVLIHACQDRASLPATGRGSSVLHVARAGAWRGVDGSRSRRPAATVAVEASVMAPGRRPSPARFTPCAAASHEGTGDAVRLPGAESRENAVNRGLPLREQTLPETHAFGPKLHRRSACGQPRGMLDVGHRQSVHGVDHRESRRQRHHGWNLGVRLRTALLTTHRCGSCGQRFAFG